MVTNIWNKQLFSLELNTSTQWLDVGSCRADDYCCLMKTMLNNSINMQWPSQLTGAWVPGGGFHKRHLVDSLIKMSHLTEIG